MGKTQRPFFCRINLNFYGRGLLETELPHFCRKLPEIFAAFGFNDFLESDRWIFFIFCTVCPRTIV